MYMIKNIFFGVIILFIPLINGFYEDYVNLLSSQDIIRKSGSIHYGLHEFNNLYDGTALKFKSDPNKENISQVNFWFQIEHSENFKLHMIRLLKLRNGQEKLNFTITFSDNTEDYVLEHNFTNGWNEIEFSNLTSIHRIYVKVSESDYNDLEIGEIQILGLNKYFLSCSEWFNQSQLVASSVFLYIIDNWISLDISKIESGSTCQSSTGNCKLAIKDSIIYIDEMWKPLATDKNIFIQINFYDRYSIEQIIVKQPIENEIDSIIIKSDERLIEMIVNKTSLFTSLQTELKTNFLRFLFYKSDNQVFLGLYEIKAIGLKPKPIIVLCESFGNFIKSSDLTLEGLGKRTYTPTTTDECSVDHQIISPSNSFFRKYKHHLAANSYYCTQYIDENGKCFKYPALKCKCTNNFNGSYYGLINLPINDLPLLKICVSKQFESSEMSQVDLTVGRIGCFYKKNFLQSNNQEIVDHNLQTCSSNIHFNRISIDPNNLESSSIEVNLWFKENNYPFDCQDIMVYKEDNTENCGSLSLCQCPFHSFENPDQFSIKLCKYRCKFGAIRHLQIVKEYQEYPDNDAKFCEATVIFNR
ncbi:DgyrCDS14569 [Dimorphilus gyrociliatus]|uniref:DgyrCDS14569 n=1 Tax=Dimorphilus gyrociliatus TaxID=2664684 RepID=A0A7I8WE32_9ANNE|nr:DgyrCDS14569 [Dimorphilus gyrociliatus]